jgi:adenosine kinase
MVGQDKFAEDLRFILDAEGIEAILQVHPDLPTGVCAVLTHERERSLVARLGAGEKLILENMLSPEVAFKIENAKFIYCAGYLLEAQEGLECILHVGRNIAVSDDKTKALFINLSGTHIVRNLRRELSIALSYADFVFGNEAEAKVTCSPSKFSS